MLKADRSIVFPEDISFRCEEVAERGLMMVHDVDDVVKVADAAPAGLLPAGLLMCDVVDYGPGERTFYNFNKDEVPVGSKVPLLRHGWVKTDQIDGNPAVGQPAYFTATGLLGVVVAGPQVGRFLSAKDEDGYAKVEILIQ